MSLQIAPAIRELQFGIFDLSLLCPCFTTNWEWCRPESRFSSLRNLILVKRTNREIRCSSADDSASRPLGF